jgi:tetratricopeptide (TPR) repeat protein
MFNKYIKLVLATGILVWAVMQFTMVHIMNGISLVMLSGIFVFLYFKNEILLLAFLRLRKQDFDGAGKWLARIKNPKSALTKNQEGYYYFLQGLMVSQTNISQAEKLFKKALNIGLSMDHDRAMAKLQLAGIAMTKRRKREATMLLAEAKKLDKHNMMAEQYKILKQQLKKI